jgi:hypothetical protein
METNAFALLGMSFNMENVKSQTFPHSFHPLLPIQVSLGLALPSLSMLLYQAQALILSQVNLRAHSQLIQTQINHFQPLYNQALAPAPALYYFRVPLLQLFVALIHIITALVSVSVTKGVISTMGSVSTVFPVEQIPTGQLTARVLVSLVIITITELVQNALKGLFGVHQLVNASLFVAKILFTLRSLLPVSVIQDTVF